MTDRELIRHCIRGERACQRMLVEKFAPRMLTVCRRYTARQQEAEDVLQEAFIRVFANLHQFRAEGSLEGWIRKIVTHCAIRYIRQTAFSYHEVSDEEMIAEEEAFARLGEEELLTMIQSLPSGYRVVFNLYVIDGYSHDEIGRLLDIEPVTSRSQLMKARKLLQQKIKAADKMIRQ